MRSPPVMIAVSRLPAGYRPIQFSQSPADRQSGKQNLTLEFVQGATSVADIVPPTCLYPVRSLVSLAEPRI